MTIVHHRQQETTLLTQQGLKLFGFFETNCLFRKMDVKMMKVM